jgi:hypothetical protein
LDSCSAGYGDDHGHRDVASNPIGRQVNCCRFHEQRPHRDNQRLRRFGHRLVITDIQRTVELAGLREI